MPTPWGLIIYTNLGRENTHSAHSNREHVCLFHAVAQSTLCYLCQPLCASCLLPCYWRPVIECLQEALFTELNMPGDLRLAGALSDALALMSQGKQGWNWTRSQITIFSDFIRCSSGAFLFFHVSLRCLCCQKKGNSQPSISISMSKGSASVWSISCEFHFLIKKHCISDNYG